MAADFTDIARLLRGACFRVDFVVLAVFVDLVVFADFAVFVDFIDRNVRVDFAVFVDRIVFVDLTDFTLFVSSNLRGRPRFDFAVVVDFASVFCGLSGFSVFRDFFDEYDLTVGVGFLYIRFCTLKNK